MNNKLSNNAKSKIPTAVSTNLLANKQRRRIKKPSNESPACRLINQTQPNRQQVFNYNRQTIKKSNKINKNLQQTKKNIDLASMQMKQLTH